MQQCDTRKRRRIRHTLLAAIVDFNSTCMLGNLTASPKHTSSNAALLEGSSHTANSSPAQAGYHVRDNLWMHTSAL
eukprot:2407977-Amphidinium_carterae.1